MHRCLSTVVDCRAPQQGRECGREQGVHQECSRSSRTALAACTAQCRLAGFAAVRGGGMSVRLALAHALDWLVARNALGALAAAVLAGSAAHGALQAAGVAAG